MIPADTIADLQHQPPDMRADLMHIATVVAGMYPLRQVGDGLGRCIFCHSVGPGPATLIHAERFPHTTDCAWMMAREVTL